LREALQNVTKHSGGRTARVEVKRDARLHVKIHDDGNGFDPHSIPVGHYGLRGMRERIFALGGELIVESENGKGTMLLLTIPLPI
jgi:signal transduction histidine kinase